jgi:short subunit dehydrogenase-like uncharacterized protein
VPAAYKVRKIAFDKNPRLAVTIGWGDVSTAFYSTGIPNIECYLATSPGVIRSMRALRFFEKPLGTEPVQRFLKKAVEILVKGPTDRERESHYSSLWGEVSNRVGKKVELRLKVPEGYSFTVDATLAAVEKVIQGSIPSGAWTPSQAFGSRFVMELRGVELLQG